MSNLRWTGVFDLYKVYEIGDVVQDTDDGFTYVCIFKTQGYPPSVENSGFEVLSSFIIPTITTIDGIDGGEF